MAKTQPEDFFYLPGLRESIWYPRADPGLKKTLGYKSPPDIRFKRQEVPAYHPNSLPVPRSGKPRPVWLFLFLVARLCPLHLLPCSFLLKLSASRPRAFQLASAAHCRCITSSLTSGGTALIHGPAHPRSPTFHIFSLQVETPCPPLASVSARP